MATRKTTSKKSAKRTKSVNPVQQIADTVLRPGAIGALLVIIAIFTLLSLFSGNRGSITGAWVGFLRGWFGWGAYLVPIVTGIFGGWLVLSAMDSDAPPPWRKPIGMLLAFLAVITGASLLLTGEARTLAAARGEAGGRIGAEIATILQDTITLYGAWALVAFVVVAALIFLFDRWLIDGVLGVYRLVGSGATGAWNRHPQEPVYRGNIDPQIPLPLGEVSMWARLRQRFADAKAGKRHDAPSAPADSFGAPHSPTLVRPVPDATQALASTPPRSAAANPLVLPDGRAPLFDAQPQGGATPSTLAATAKPGAVPAASAGLELPQPRIFGGAQEWRLPPVDDMLKDWERRTDSDETIRNQGKLIQETLSLFGVPADFEGAYKGPSVTQYLIKPGYVERNVKGEAQRIKVKVAKIASLSNDLALALAAPSVRIEAPIPGTTYVGIEVPNHESNVVGLKELMESESYTGGKGRLKIALGEDVKGQAVTADLARMPHLLIAGATGSGKSVCVNSIITCLLLTHTPDTLRFLMVDPKMVELSVYNGVPHLLSPVVTEVDKAAGVLYWAVKEMERRYNLFSKAGARDITRFNEFLVRKGEKALPYIVIIVDEMADLMMAAPEEVEKHICRLAQMARATGMHLIIATQRPSVDVITGLIKANFPARIAFRRNQRHRQPRHPRHSRCRAASGAWRHALHGARRQ
jgi:S-DNA-T family DNA segregation ATPase FtsK/SpoIIIE